MLLALLLATVSAHAGFSRAREPLTRVRQDLAALDRLCAAEEAKPAGTCASSSAGECRKVYAAFDGARARAEAKVKEAARWWAQRGAVSDDGRTVTITFDLASLPDYPYRGSDAITNEALDSSIRSLDRMSAETRGMEKRRGCRRETRELRETWDGEGESVSGYHNALGASISDFLLEAVRALQAGAAEEAAAGLRDAIPGASTRPVSR
jgi:hypothetical protein